MRLHELSLSLAQLHSFREAAREGTFSRAAARLGITQPSVSNHVRALEETFAVRLFVRAGKTVRLTSEGEALLPYAQTALRSLEDALTVAGELRGVRSGKLTVGAATTIGIYMLPSEIGRFSRRFPGIEVAMLIMNNRDVLHGVLAHQVDLGFVVGDIPAGLVAHPYLIDEYVLVVWPGHPLARRRHVTARVLAGERFLVREEGSGTREFVDKQLARKGIRPGTALTLGSTEAIKQAAAARLGVSIVSKHTIRLELAARTLVALPIRDLDLRRQLFAIHHERRPLSSSARAFLEMLHDGGTARPRRAATGPPQVRR